MKRIILFLTLCFYFVQAGISQSSLKDIRKKSWITYVYRIPADTAQKYVTKGISDIDHYLAQQPFTNYHRDSVEYENLPVGNYILISVLDNELYAEYYCSTNIRSFVVNDQHRPQLLIRDEAGTMYRNATVWVDSKPARFIDKAGTYQVKQKNPEDEIVKIVVPGDTSFTKFSILRENHRSPRQQRWTRFRGSRVGRVVAWFPDKVTHLIKNKPRSWFRKRYRGISSQGKGYMVFNKPKYFPADTIKFKAYIVDRKGKPYKKEVQAYLNYNSRGTHITKKLRMLRPVSPGAYVHEFATGDSLQNDTRFTVSLKSKDNKPLVNGNFKIEDYLLDEVAVYNLGSPQKKYFTGDTLRFTAAAKDANGLPLMDGKIKLYLLNKSVGKFYKEREFVPDTLWQEEEIMAVDGDTKFAIPSAAFPIANLDIRAVAVFRNSNNEIQEKEETITYEAAGATIDIKQEKGWITAVYYENGRSVAKNAWMETDLSDMKKPVRFPYSAKIDPQAETYQFYTENERGRKDVFNNYEVADDYRVYFNRFQENDSAGFVLSNPNRIPVYYTVFDQDKEIAKAASENEWINWKGKMPAGKLYTLKWQYYWAGEEKYDQENVGLLTKLMSAEIKSAETVYPGQTDTITVAIKDYKKREARNVNLTAVSYNTQLGKDIFVPEPPYIQRFRGKSPIRYDWYETEEIDVAKRFLLGQHQRWRQPFGLDTMSYYKFLFPGKEMHLVRTLVQSILPQVAVFAVQKGVPQEIYLLYINRQLVYYNGVTDKSAYAISQYPGYVQIGIRLKDKYIETDSIYLQPYYKHDVVFDIDLLSAKAKLKPMPDYWTEEERRLLNEKILRIENNGRNNYGYVWQGDRLVYLGSNAEHAIGPFNTYDSIQFYKPEDFDFKFYFEPGYRYRITPKMVRLEKRNIFQEQDKVYLPAVKNHWMPGDTIPPVPGISYARKSESKSKRPFLEHQGYNYYHSSYTASKIFIRWPSSTNIAYTILHQGDTSKEYKVLWGGVSYLNNLHPGNYTVILVTQDFRMAEAGNISITRTGTYCINIDTLQFKNSNKFVYWLLGKQYRKEMEEEEIWKRKREEENRQYNSYQAPQMNLPPGNGMIMGKVTDDKGGDGVPGASIMIKGYRTGTSCRPDGTFVLTNLREGRYVLQVSAVGYEVKEIAISIIEGERNTVNVSLNTSAAGIAEVVVVGYSTQRKKSMTYSVATVKSEQLSQVLEGKLAGVYIEAGGNIPVMIRGISSVNGNDKPLVILDGVPVDEMPADLDSSAIASITTLKGAAAETLYGSRAASGAIIINTKGFSPKMLREQFRDYAVWQPNLITDENGEVKFAVTYPDNITSWQTYVVGMDKKRRITKASKLVRSFKPVMAQLAGPQFLIAGDSAVLIGKKVNYTTSAMDVGTRFSVNGRNLLEKNETLVANNSSIDELSIAAKDKEDTVKASFTLKATNGFADGELRKIPVLQKGTAETIGNFYVLEKDTTVSFSADPNAGTIKLYGQNNTLDILLEEIEHLKNYPYYCMEQTASKLRGLAMEKKIRAALNQVFKNEKEMQKLVDKLQKGQLFEGSWGWWEGGKANLMITNYITKSLLELRGNTLLETNIRNALLYLQNQLQNPASKLNRYDLLETLYTLSEAGHDMDYYMYLRKIPFDSVSIHQQWQIVNILQQQKMNYEKELQVLMTKKTETMTGGLYWGTDSYWWSSNRIATTVLAFKTLSRENSYSHETGKIIQFFLEMRKCGHWTNTVESASILSAIVPKKLEENKNFTRPATLSLKGDTTFTITAFPFVTSVSQNVRVMDISKTGGGMVYFTAYQEIFNPAPLPVDSNFRITSYFENNIGRVSSLKAGEKVKMKVVVEALKDADYVQIEIPIPAGCTYGKKTGDSWNEHREYFKNKTMIFAERLYKGRHEYEIELEPRYTGSYTINPAKAELMYFPTFYGRNGLSEIKIRK